MLFLFALEEAGCKVVEKEYEENECMNEIKY
jgi:hypothetical protein